MHTRRTSLALLALLLLLAACAGDDTSAESTAGGTAEAPLGSADHSGGQGYAAEAEEPTGDEAAEGFAGADADDEQLLPEQASVRSGERLVKDGTMTLEVAEGGFMQAYRRVIDLARDLGGYLTESSSANLHDGGTYGTVTVRVPVDAYEDLLTRVGQVGTVRGQQISSRDVTAEYTDLESRLRHLRAQEAFYLELLEEAQGVQDAIAVKQQLDGIQSQIEQARGRLNVLEDRTAFSTLTVEIVEPGADPVVASAGGRTLAGYWETARAGFVTVVGWILVAAVSLAPVAVPLLVAVGLWWVWRRRGPVAAALSDSD